MGRTIQTTERCRVPCRCPTPQAGSWRAAGDRDQLSHSELSLWRPVSPAVSPRGSRGRLFAPTEKGTAFQSLVGQRLCQRLPGLRPFRTNSAGGWVRGRWSHGVLRYPGPLCSGRRTNHHRCCPSPTEHSDSSQIQSHRSLFRRRDRWNPSTGSGKCCAITAAVPGVPC